MYVPFGFMYNPSHDSQDLSFSLTRSSSMAHSSMLDAIFNTQKIQNVWMDIHVLHCIQKSGKFSFRSKRFEHVKQVSVEIRWHEFRNSLIVGYAAFHYVDSTVFKLDCFSTVFTIEFLFLNLQDTPPIIVLLFYWIKCKNCFGQVHQVLVCFNKIRSIDFCYVSLISECALKTISTCKNWIQCESVNRLSIWNGNQIRAQLKLEMVIFLLHTVMHIRAGYVSVSFNLK